jgi:hypothetical protein
MADDKNRSARSVAAGLAGFLATVVAVNVLLRVVPLPDVDLPPVALPDLPGWVGDVVRIKNWVLLAVIVVVVVGAVVNEVAKDRARAGDDAEE